MARQVSIPQAAWPLEMPADFAAGYVGERSVEAFLAKVKQGVYPQPARGRGIPAKWHRLKLDQAVASRHGIRLDKFIIDDATGLI